MMVEKNHSDYTLGPTTYRPSTYSRTFRSPIEFVKLGKTYIKLVASDKLEEWVVPSSERAKQNGGEDLNDYSVDHI